MAVTIGSLVAEVNANIQGFLSGVQRVSEELTKLSQKPIKVVLELDDSGLTNAIKRLDRNVNDFVLKTERITNAIVGLFDQIDGTLGNVETQFKRTTQNIVNSSQQLVEDRGSTIVRVLKGIFDKLDPFVIATITGSIAALTNLFSAADSGRVTFERLFASVVDFGSGAQDKAITLGSALGKIKTILIDIFTIPSAESFLDLFLGLRNVAFSFLGSVTSISIVFGLLRRGINALLGRIGADPEAGVLGRFSRLITAIDNGLLGINRQLAIFRARVGVLLGGLTAITGVLSLATGLVPTLSGFFLTMVGTLTTVKSLFTGVFARAQVGFIRFRAALGDGRAQLKLVLFSLRELFPIVEAVASVAKPLAGFIRAGGIQRFGRTISDLIKTLQSAIPKMVAAIERIASSLTEEIRPAIQKATELSNRAGDSIDKVSDKIREAGGSAKQVTDNVQRELTKVKDAAEKTGLFGRIAGAPAGFLGNVKARIATVFGGIGRTVKARPVEAGIVGAGAAGVIGTGVIVDLLKGILSQITSVATVAAKAGTGSAVVAASPILATVKAMTTALLNVAGVFTGAAGDLLAFAAGGPFQLALTLVGTRFIVPFSKALLTELKLRVGSPVADFFKTRFSAAVETVRTSFVGRFLGSISSKIKELLGIGRERAAQTTGAFDFVKRAVGDTLKIAIGSLPGLGGIAQRTIQRRQQEASIALEARRQKAAEQLRISALLGVKANEAAATQLSRVSKTVAEVNVGLQALASAAKRNVNFDQQVTDEQRQLIRMFDLTELSGTELRQAIQSLAGEFSESQSVFKRLSSFAKTGVGIAEEEFKRVAETVRRVTPAFTDLFKSETGLGNPADAARQREIAQGILRRQFGSITGGLKAEIPEEGQKVFRDSTLSLKQFGALVDTVQKRFGGVVVEVSGKTANAGRIVDEFSQAVRRAEQSLELAGQTIRSQIVGAPGERGNEAPVGFRDLLSPTTLGRIFSTVVSQAVGVPTAKGVQTPREKAEITSSLALGFEAISSEFKPVVVDVIRTGLEKGTNAVFNEIRRLQGRSGPGGRTETTETIVQQINKIVARVFGSGGVFKEGAGGREVQEAVRQLRVILEPLRGLKDLTSLLVRGRGRSSGAIESQLGAFEKFSGQAALDPNFPKQFGEALTKAINSGVRNLKAGTIKDALKSAGIPLALGESIVAGALGIGDKLQGALTRELGDVDIRSALQTVLEVFARNLEFKSPPKEGPLRRALLSMVKFGPTVTDQINRGVGQTKQGINKFIQQTFGELEHRSPAGGLLGRIENSFTKFGAVIGERILSGANVLQQSLTQLVQDGFSGIPRAIGNLVGTALEAPFKLLGFTIRSVSKLVTGLVSGIGGFVSGIGKRFTGLASVLGLPLKLLGDTVSAIGAVTDALVSGLAAAVETVGKALGGLAKFAGDTFSKLLGTLLETNEEIVRTGRSAENLRLPVSDFDALSRAIGQTNVSADEFSQSLLQLQRSIGQALSGSQDVLDTFKLLGITINDLRRENVQDIFLRIVSGFNKVKESGDDANRTLDLLGAGFGNLRTVIVRGSDDLAEALSSLRGQGGIISAAEVERAEQVSKAMVRLGQLVDRLKIVLLDTFGPTLVSAIDVFEDNATVAFAFVKRAITATVESVKAVITFIEERGFGGLVALAEVTFAEIANVLFSTFTRAKDAIIESVTGDNIGARILNAAEAIIDVLVTRIRRAISGLLGDAASALSKSSRNVKRSLNPVDDALALAQKAALNASAGIADALSDAFEVDEDAGKFSEAFLAAMTKLDPSKVEAAAKTLRRDVVERVATSERKLGLEVTGAIPLDERISRLREQIKEEEAAVIKEREASFKRISDKTTDIFQGATGIEILTPDFEAAGITGFGKSLQQKIREATQTALTDPGAVDLSGLVSSLADNFDKIGVAVDATRLREFASTIGNFAKQDFSGVAKLEKNLQEVKEFTAEAEEIRRNLEKLAGAAGGVVDKNLELAEATEAGSEALIDFGIRNEEAAKKANENKQAAVGLLDTIGGFFSGIFDDAKQDAEETEEIAQSIVDQLEVIRFQNLEEERVRERINVLYRRSIEANARISDLLGEQNTHQGIIAARQAEQVRFAQELEQVQTRIRESNKEILRTLVENDSIRENIFLNVKGTLAAQKEFAQASDLRVLAGRLQSVLAEIRTVPQLTLEDTKVEDLVKFTEMRLKDEFKRVGLDLNLIPNLTANLTASDTKEFFDKFNSLIKGTFDESKVNLADLLAKGQEIDPAAVQELLGEFSDQLLALPDEFRVKLSDAIKALDAQLKLIDVQDQLLSQAERIGDVQKDNLTTTVRETVEFDKIAASIRQAVELEDDFVKDKAVALGLTTKEAKDQFGILETMARRLDISDRLTDDQEKNVQLVVEELKRRGQIVNELERTQRQLDLIVARGDFLGTEAGLTVDPDKDLAARIVGVKKVADVQAQTDAEREARLDSIRAKINAAVLTDKQFLPLQIKKLELQGLENASQEEQVNAVSAEIASRMEKLEQLEREREISEHINDRLSSPIASSVGETIRGAIDGSLSEAISSAREQARAAGVKFNAALFVISKFAGSLFNKLLDNIIADLTTEMSKALTDVFKDSLGIADKTAAGLAQGALAVGTLILSKLQDSANVVKDTVNSAVESTEAIRGVISGDTTVKLKEVGEQLAEANQPIVERLDRIISLMSRGRTLGAAAPAPAGGGQDLQALLAGSN